MATYEVNVRAIVTATRGDAGASGDIAGWDQYDFEALERDADDQPLVVQIRCDQFVTVEADNQEDAVENAKNDATAIEMEGFSIDGVTLWVDEDIDITLIELENGTQAPSS
ncbi:hypothetical protein G6L37_00115 [Agrobacterium rubi]|nr:hypothetical protein [Agrobacterium rubi]NTF23654.1 hypothetical protein [Agrobacterium rubi]